MAEGEEAAAQSRLRRSRSAARLAAVQALYEMELAEAPADPVLEEFIAGRWRQGAAENGGGAGAPDVDLLGDVVRGVAAGRERLDRLVDAALAGGWTVERLETLLRLILRAGAYELLERKDTAARVAITEYVNVAHAFFFGKEAALVNAVLDRIAREVRAEEMGAGADGGPADRR